MAFLNMIICPDCRYGRSPKSKKLGKFKVYETKNFIILKCLSCETKLYRKRLIKISTEVELNE